MNIYNHIEAKQGLKTSITTDASPKKTKMKQQRGPERILPQTCHKNDTQNKETRNEYYRRRIAKTKNAQDLLGGESAFCVTKQTISI